MLQYLLEYEFLRNSFLTGLIIGMISPLLGVFIVLRRQSLIADALSHVTLSGIAASLFLGKLSPFWATLNPVYGGMIFSIGGALLIEKLRTVYRHYEELAIPIIMSFGVGLGVVFISLANGFNADLFSYLFGSVSAVSTGDLYLIIFISVIVLLCIIFLFKELFLLSFDEEYGKVSGLRVKTINFIFIIMVAVVIAISMQIVGVLLVSSLMTLPVAASIRVAKSFKGTIFYAIFFGELAVVGGLVSAYYFNLAPGGTIVILATLILVLAICNKQMHIRYNKMLSK